MTEFLYGLPGAEQLYDSPNAVWECEIEDYAEDDETGPWTIEKWTARQPHEHLPSGERVWGWISDWVADSSNSEIGEEWWDDFASWQLDAVEDLNAVLFKIGQRVTFRMAYEKVGEHVLTVSDDGVVLLDGQPMYRKADQ